MEVTIDLCKWWVSERESIRIGLGSDDPIMNTSRFCNVHREDDKVSKWIFNNCSSYIKVAIARLINRVDLLEEWQGLQFSTEAFLRREGPVTNAGAYQFYPKKGEKMRDIITEINSPTTIIALDECKGKTIHEAALHMSNTFGRSLHFYWMMVILDLGHMKLLEIDMNSEPYMGPGGQRIIKDLGISLERMAFLLNVKQYTAEHIACEVRKYVERCENGIPNNRKFNTQKSMF